MIAEKTPTARNLTRRGALISGFALLIGGCASVPKSLVQSNPHGIDPQFRRQRVAYDGPGRTGTIVVNRAERFLYSVEEDGWATRYGIGVGKEGRTLSGTLRIGRKAEWPSWTPTANMMRRDPRLLQYASGVPGGPQNPLGARALYLHRGGRDTMYRIHGTNEPWSIGQAVSSGCIRLLNEDIIHLYENTPVGTTVTIV